MTEINAQALQQLKDLALYPLPQLEKVAANLSIRPFKTNEIIFDQDEDAKLVYLLLSGVVKFSYLHSDENQTIVSLHPEGEFFGLDSLIPQMKHPFRCEAFENCTVGTIKPQTLVEILLGISYEIFLRWHTGAMNAGRKIYVHCIKGIGLDLRKRLALELMNLADHFGRADARGIVIDLNISHEVLAGIVGASRQQVTEHLNRFDRDKCIARDGRRIIINAQKLRRIIEMGDQ
ncbi:MAG: Crp/Fnr family transcriptional regulator [Candidatus Binatia bacterium]